MLRLLVEHESVLPARDVNSREGLAFLAGDLPAHVGAEHVYDVVDPGDRDRVSRAVNQCPFLSLTRGLAVAPASPR
jgi:hypothetical protein